MNAIIKLFHMTDEVWARHANPLSIWTRYTGLPLLALSVWSRVWLGIYALIPILLSVFWIWLNPRFFPKPLSTDNWASKAVIGERIWLAHPKDQIPAHHRRTIAALNILTGAAFILALYGLYALQLWPTITGTLLTILGKSWFLDRMVWLQQDLVETRDLYKSWHYDERR